MREIKDFIKEDLIMVDTEGTIIASTDSKRVGTFHEGALFAMKENQMRVITKADEQILQGVRAGINLPILHQQKVVGVIGITGSPETVLPYGELIKKMTELLIQENHYQDQFEWEARTLETFVFDWLLAKESLTSIEKRAELLGINLQLPRQVALMEWQNESAIATELALNPDDIIVRWGEKRMILLLAPSDEESTTRKISSIHQKLENHTQAPVFLGVGQNTSSTNIQSSYQEAERALKTCTPEKPIVFDSDLRLEIMLQAIPLTEKTAFSSRILKSVLEENELLETLKTYFKSHLSLKDTAMMLHIHINTLHYRLRKIESLTNLQLKNVDDLTALNVSLHFLEETTKN